MTVTQAFDGVAEMLAKLDPAKIVRRTGNVDAG
jgi:hypothetical protein